IHGPGQAAKAGQDHDQSFHGYSPPLTPGSAIGNVGNRCTFLPVYRLGPSAAIEDGGAICGRRA
ncbi:MAG TPA: hypothetical protein PLG59_14560, partial [bacterium]|nr:hypothetical protein [bacterium]